MSVRRVPPRNPEGKKRLIWMIDIEYTHPDGRRERVRKVSPVQTLRGAERYEREVRQALLDGTYGKEEEQPAPRLAGFADRFINDYAMTSNKPSEIESKQSIFRKHLIPAFGRKRLDAIGPAEVDAYKAKKKRAGLAPKSINNHVAVLHTALAVACSWNLIKEVPTFKWMKVTEPEVDFLDFEEAARLIHKARPDDRTMILLALKTGMRLGELRALRWGDLYLNTAKLVVRRSLARGEFTVPKSGKSREIPLSPLALEELHAYQHLKGELVFSQPDGSPLRKDHCNENIWRACRLARIRRIGWHCLRHSFASHLVMRNVPLKAVQELMGHTTMKMTMRYSHLSPDIHQDAVAMLDQPAERQHGGNTAAGSVISLADSAKTIKKPGT